MSRGPRPSHVLTGAGIAAGLLAFYDLLAAPGDGEPPLPPQLHGLVVVGLAVVVIVAAVAQMLATDRRHDEHERELAAEERGFAIGTAYRDATIHEGPGRLVAVPDARRATNLDE